MASDMLVASPARFQSWVDAGAPETFRDRVAGRGAPHVPLVAQGARWDHDAGKFRKEDAAGAAQHRDAADAGV